MSPEESLAAEAEGMRGVGTTPRAPKRDAEEHFVERVGKGVRRLGEHR